MLQEGASFGPYHVRHRLGAGGMGEVYLAFDSRLQRDVALKVLTTGGADAASRLIREARLASTLGHPNICTVFEAGEIDGQAFIAMEHVAGQPLSHLVRRERLSVDRVIRLGVQMADGLAHAHAQGVVHRDFKSSNVIVGADGRIKILDFGIAIRVAADVHEPTAAATQSVEARETLAGTLPYMAPEVLRGGTADARSDIWALGVVLFEMAAAHRPFAGGNQYELTSAILMTPAPDLPGDAPSGLHAIVRKCLAKEPGERYERASEVKAALEAIGSMSHAEFVARPRRSTTGRTAAVGALIIAAIVVAALGWRWRTRPVESTGARRIRAIAVLPLTNLSGDATQDYFADGMTEALITDLARVKGLDVISRTSVMQYKATQKTLRQIARELTVDAVVEGSVIRAGDRVRITAQLIEASSDRHLWANDYDRDARDVLTLQHDVARAIAREVRATLTPQDEAQLAGGRRTVDPTAHEAYLKGRFYSARLTEESIARAIELFQQAIAREPEWAEPWAALANAYIQRGIWGATGSSREISAQARAAIARALALDGSLGEAHTVLGAISEQYDWDWATAEREMKHGIEVSGGAAFAYAEYGTFLHVLKRFPAAIAEAELVRRLDPLSAPAASQLARLYYRARQFDQAIAAFYDSMDLDRQYLPNYARLADVYLATGHYNDALDWLEKGQAISGGTRRQSDGFGVAYALAGRKADALEIIDQLKAGVATRDQFSYSIAMVETALGNHDQAIAWLNRAFEARSSPLWLVNVELKFDPLRDDPRFKDLLRRMNFPSS
ncbi:MAG: protein kinase [Acidobacteria bacterium]|nr:protein kinase [Acidobacteriota bacterium]